jgi:2-dehydro-3-deoxygluconokinase
MTSPNKGIISIKASLEFAVAASALKHMLPEDFNLVMRAEAEALVGKDAAGRLRR